MHSFMKGCVYLYKEISALSSFLSYSIFHSVTYGYQQKLVAFWNGSFGDGNRNLKTAMLNVKSCLIFALWPTRDVSYFHLSWYDLWISFLSNIYPTAYKILVVPFMDSLLTLSTCSILTLPWRFRNSCIVIRSPFIPPFCVDRGLLSCLCRSFRSSLVPFLLHFLGSSLALFCSSASKDNWLLWYIPAKVKCSSCRSC